MKVSIVLATYNGAAYVTEFIESVLRGSRRPEEWIVVDDRSVDGTPNMVSELLGRNDHVHLIVHDRNQGAARSFVRGALRSTGDVVLFADQDDVWHADRIERMVAVFERRPGTVMVHCDGWITNDRLEKDGRTIFNTRKRPDLHLGASRPPMDIAGNPDVKGCTAAFNGAFLRSLFTTTGDRFQEFWGHDHWSALFAYGVGPVEVINAPLFLHRFHANNTSGAVKFNPFSLTHVRKYLRTVRTQREDHDLLRYQIACAEATRFPAWRSAELLEALMQLRSIALRRLEARRSALPKRLLETWRIHKEGIYRTRFNGMATWFRDLFLQGTH